MPKLLLCSDLSWVVQHSTLERDTVGHFLLQDNTTHTAYLTMDSRHVRILYRDLRCQQYYPSLGLGNMLPDQREESLLSGHCQLPRGRIVHLDALHVAGVG